MRTTLRQLKRLINETLFVYWHNGRAIDATTVLATHRHLEQELGMLPTVSDIAEELKVPEEVVKQIVKTTKGLDINPITGEVMCEQRNRSSR